MGWFLIIMGLALCVASAAAGQPIYAAVSFLVGLGGLCVLCDESKADDLTDGGPY